MKNKPTIEILAPVFSVCKVKEYSGIDISQPFCFTCSTDTERSLVCPDELVPEKFISRENGWRCFRIQGTLDFSLIGILADITGILAEKNISVFAISTYDTDYILGDILPPPSHKLRGGGFSAKNTSVFR